jgi:hypothetical protein
MSPAPAPAYGRSEPEPKKAPAKTTSCTATHYPDQSAPRIPIVRGEDGKLNFDVGPPPGGTAPVARSKSKAPTHRERADGIHSWVNEAAPKGVFDRTNGVQDQEGFTAFLGEFDPSKMKYSDYQAKYQEYLAGHMPGKIAGQSLLGAGLITTIVPPTSAKPVVSQSAASEPIGRTPTATGAQGGGTTYVKTVQELLKPGGEFVGSVRKGATVEIRTVPSSDFSTLQQELLAGAEPSGSYAGGKGIWYNLPSGGRVGVRSSKESGLTLDIDIPGLPKGFKVHQQ